MISGWADAKRFLAEDIVIYSVVIGIALFWDFFVNLAISVCLYNPTHEFIHPYQFGVGQIGILFFAAIQLARKLKDWQYWK